MRVILKEYKISFGYFISLDFEKDVIDLDGLKTSIVKRLGNVRASTKENSRQLNFIKPAIKESKSVEEMVQRVNRLSRWNIEIRR